MLKHYIVCSNTRENYTFGFILFLFFFSTKWQNDTMVNRDREFSDVIFTNDISTRHFSKPHKINMCTTLRHPRPPLYILSHCKITDDQTYVQFTTKLHVSAIIPWSLLQNEILSIQHFFLFILFVNLIIRFCDKTYYLNFDLFIECYFIKT